MRKTCMFLVIAVMFSVMFLPVVLMSTQTQQRSQKVVIKVENGEQIDLYEGSYALLIGASDYTKGWKKLPGVKKDLEEIEKALQRQGFEVEVALNPTSKEFDQAMKSFIRKYGRRANNRLIIYFAGHGETLRTADGRKQGYIVPVDAPTPNRDAAGFKELAINMGLIEIFARDIEAKHAMFVFDSCFSGTLFRGNEGRPPAMTSRAAKPVRQFITAGDENQTVPDESIFRQMFVRGLEGEADRDEDGYVTGSELGYFLETRVANYSNNSQTPRSGKIRNPDLDQGDFVFVLAKPSIAARPKPKIEIEREVPLGTLIVIANRKDMEILLDKEVVAKSKVAGERITIKNVEAGKLVEIVGRVAGEKDIVEQVELVIGTKVEISLGKLAVEGNNTSNNSSSTPSTTTISRREIKAGTIFRLSMDTYLTSRTAEIGDPFIATVFEDVRINGEVVVTKGAKIEGKVSSVKAAEKKRKSGTLGINFSRLRLSNGQIINVEGQLASLDALEQRQIDEEGRVFGGSSVKRNVVFIGGGKAGSAAIGAIAGGGSGAAIGAGVGASEGILGSIFSKGEEAQVMSDQKFGMELLRPVILADASNANDNPDPRNSAANDRNPRNNSNNQNLRSGNFRKADLKSTVVQKRAQKALLDLNYYKGPLNGINGPSTRTAIRAFQRDYDLQQTGDLDLDTAYQLGLVNEDGVEILPVRVLNATADHEGYNIKVKANAETNSGGWQIYTSTQVDGDQLHVYIVGAPPVGGSSQALTKYPVQVPMVDNYQDTITKVIVHGSGDPITIPLTKKP